MSAVPLPTQVSTARPPVRPIRRYTTEEWLALEAKTGMRYEYLDGELLDITAMAGGTIPHTKACGNVQRRLGNAVEKAGKGCYAFNEGMKLHVDRYNRYYCPDASVVCGEEEEGPVTGSYTNPTLVVEVVSPSSYKRDLGKRFKHYRSLESLRDYVLVYLDRYQVDVFSRDAPRTIFRYQSFDGLESEAEFPSLGVSVSLANIYERVAIIETADDEAE